MGDKSISGDKRNIVSANNFLDTNQNLWTQSSESLKSVCTTRVSDTLGSSTGPENFVTWHDSRWKQLKFQLLFQNILWEIILTNWKMNLLELHSCESNAISFL